ncbi:OmpA family protein [Pseudocolwellia agarivorans]|uniref:OmpA family protein n=1 Tax=Pseudocolwellia agarivorans TaxID=1911682 RepID=UPI00098750F1|nr:OmpA family protein [Pseudocolwellia agarivorans]
MKFFKISLLTAIISTSAMADETIDKTWELGVFGDYIKSSTAKESSIDWQQMEAGKSIGIDLQKAVNDFWKVRIELARTRYDVFNGTDKAYGNRYGVDAIYTPEDSDMYLFTGVKRFNNAESYNALNVGVGYNFKLSDRSSFYTEAVVYRDVDYGYTDQGFKLGYKYAFGDTKKSTPAKVDKPVKTANVQPVVKKELDGDKDGVFDKNDLCKDTPTNVKVDSRGCTLYAEESVSIKLNVNFPMESAALSPASMIEIQRLADFMKEYKNTDVVIEGHTSATGEADYNLALSEKRAYSVKNALINNFNISANRLSAVGFGETQLLSQGNTAADHKANRRVVAQIETTTKNVVKK